MPTVAIAVRTPLVECLTRQADRPASKQVPPEAIERQDAGVPTRAQLLAEGWGQVHDAADLDLLQMMLERTVETGLDPLTEVRATFGEALAAVFAYDLDTDSTYDGTFAIAGREITVGWSDAGDPFDHHWQARIDGETCECGGALWVKVTGPRDLLDVYRGGRPDDPVCERCDAARLHDLIQPTPEPFPERARLSRRSHWRTHERKRIELTTQVTSLGNTARPGEQGTVNGLGADRILTVQMDNGRPHFLCKGEYKPLPA